MQTLSRIGPPNHPTRRGAHSGCGNHARDHNPTRRNDVITIKQPIQKLENQSPFLAPDNHRILKGTYQIICACGHVQPYDASRGCPKSNYHCIARRQQFPCDDCIGKYPTKPERLKNDDGLNYDLDNPGFQRYADQNCMNQLGKWFRNINTTEADFMRSDDCKTSVTGKVFSKEDRQAHWKWIAGYKQNKIQRLWDRWVSTDPQNA